ncbi:hypothetical protein [Sulfuricurvum sp.]|uniref:hypothetical protein n=1 Tax=Sulfuricurvum sp. TaxID=2025608 RepID=UPI00286DA725|nr:hypothetical protein [Sulfuricurvum sp.]
MKVERYNVFSNADYFHYQSSNKQDFQRDEIKEEHSSQNNFKGDESIGSSSVTDNTISANTEEKLLIRDLSTSLLEGIRQSIELGDNFGFRTIHSEAEALTFDTTATIKTDNREIELNLSVSLSRSFVEQTKIVHERVEEKFNALMDPLVIELKGSFPSLNSKTFSFDIDSDGAEDQISMLGNTSAFLALDKNSNGIIDNGNELFGAKSGNGFQELRMYDEDKNGWIDENDSIFNKLRVWYKTENRDELIAIGEVGIGAIYLGDIVTPFEVKNSSNELLGVMRKSSFFLFENGKGGMISQIDLAVLRENTVQETISSANNTMKKLQGINLYKINIDEDSDSIDIKLEKLKKRLQSLEVKLQKAREEEKISIQAQIYAVQLQMMELISQ